MWFQVCHDVVYILVHLKITSGCEIVTAVLSYCVVYCCVCCVGLVKATLVL